MDKIPPPKRPPVTVPPRKKESAKKRAAFFLLHGGICHFCGEKIAPDEPWHKSHLIDRELNGDDSDENQRPAHVSCHKAYTHGEGNKAIRRASRLFEKDRGPKKEKKRPINSPGFRKDGPKQKIQSPGFPKKGQRKWKK